jgi:hypothetical protein
LCFEVGSDLCTIFIVALLIVDLLKVDILFMGFELGEATEQHRYFGLILEMLVEELAEL